MISPNPAFDLHDKDAHKRDRKGNGWPSCDRCIELCVRFHDEHGIGHLVPAELRRRSKEVAAATRHLEIV